MLTIVPGGRVETVAKRQRADPIRNAVSTDTNFTSVDDPYDLTMETRNNSS